MDAPHESRSAGGRRRAGRRPTAIPTAPFLAAAAAGADRQLHHRHRAVDRRPAASLIPKRRMVFDSKLFPALLPADPGQPPALRRARRVRAAHARDDAPLCGRSCAATWRRCSRRSGPPDRLRVERERRVHPRSVAARRPSGRRLLCGRILRPRRRDGDLPWGCRPSYRGRADRHPLINDNFPPIPLYHGTPWFLPLAGAYYGLKDWL